MAAQKLPSGTEYRPNAAGRAAHHGGCISLYVAQQ